MNILFPLFFHLYVSECHLIVQCFLLLEETRERERELIVQCFLLLEETREY